ncbi:MAG TPA: lysylphosphatidylglycerol synthase transmembrane domain-containing protein [Bryobacteraceae bacterium]|nr:lysylphosphatidylglycerol synthase transmembrane domain-containing protein [Bryobacteraceae bacterium]
MAPETPDVRVRSRVFAIVTIIVSLACLGWALHGVSWTELWDDIRTLDWRWVALGGVADVLVYVIQGWRWSLLLRPVGTASTWSSVSAIYVGLFANEVLPLRAGELIRCFLQARWSEIPISVTLASALIERIFDGVLLIAGLFFSLDYVRHFPLNRGQARAIRILADGTNSLAVLIVIGAILLAIAMFWREQALDALLNARMFSWVHVFVKDLHVIGHSRYLYFSALVSVPYLLLQVVPIYALMQAYGLDEGSWARAAALMVLIRLASVVPQAPGNVGLFQVISTLGLTLFGVQQPEARRFTLILWGVITLPLLFAGFVAMVVTGAKMADIHREARAEMRARQEERG